MRRSIIGSLVVESLVALAVFGAFRLASLRMTEDGFSYYAIGRRIFGSINLPLMLGTGLALPRALPHAVLNENQKFRPTGLVLSAIVLVAGAHLFVFLALGWYPDTFSARVFGNNWGASITASVIWALTGLAAHGLGLAIARGLLNFRVANYLKLSNLAVFPIVVLLWKANDPVSLFFWIGVLQSLNAIGSMLFLMKPLGLPMRGELHLVECARMHVHFGFPRVPGELAVTGIMSLPVLFAANRLNPHTAAELAVGITLIGVVIAMCASVDLVLLPTLSGLLAARQTHSIARLWRLWTMIAVVTGLAATTVVHVFAPVVATLLLPQSGESAIYLFRGIAYAMPGAALSVVLRSFNDALNPYPYNALIAIASLAVVAGCLLLTDPGLEWMSLVAGLLFNGVITAIVSLWQVRRAGGNLATRVCREN